MHAARAVAPILKMYSAGEGENTTRLEPNLIFEPTQPYQAFRREGYNGEALTCTFHFFEGQDVAKQPQVIMLLICDVTLDGLTKLHDFT